MTQAVLARFRPAEVIRPVLRVSIGLLLVTSAVLKSIEPDAMWPMLAFLGIGGAWASLSLAVLVSVEAFLALALLCSRVRWAAPGVVVLLLGFSVVLAASALAKDPPSCGCMGELRVFESERTEALFGIGRNLTVIAVLLWTMTPVASRTHTS